MLGYRRPELEPLLLVRHEVGDQLRPTAARQIVAHDHRGVAYLRLGSQGGLDLPRLDPEAADLDLVVDPPEELQRSVAQAPGAVAGPVEPLAGALGIRQEALGGQLRTLEIATGDPEPADP